MKSFNTIHAIGRIGLKLARQGGFALISAIFLLVTLAALGVVMMTLMTAQQTASGMDVMGSRAYQAARAGTEWALFSRLNPQVNYNTPTYCPSSSATASTTVTNNLTLPAGTTLSSFTVTVQCVATPSTITTAYPIVRTITAWACNQPVANACPGTPGPDYVEREVQVSTQESN
ncbi:MAG TPA: agglutinin biogenesis protein MshP [Burkholderiaceae bacterium]|jgi:MSHA biogenesis protein MshP|nr:agglutinin biogenesis protein MshP [Burkholderiaceae bacterium]